MEKLFLSQFHIRTIKIPWTLDLGTNWRGLGGKQKNKQTKNLLNNLLQELIK